MTKPEYLEQKVQIDKALDRIAGEIEDLEKELANIQTPADLETLESFISTIRDVALNGEGLTPQIKREVMQALHVTVWIEEDKSVRIEGWFGPPIEGLSYTTSVRCVQQATPFLINVHLPRHSARQPTRIIVGQVELAK